MNLHDIKVSTIIPSYNKHHYLQEALFSALNQTHENQEIIIVNDYPSIQAREELQEIAKVDPRIRVLHNTQNIGIARSRNKGIDVSTGECTAFLDHDDLRHDREKLDKQLGALHKDKNISVVGTQYITIDAEGNHLYKSKKPETDKQIREVLNFFMPALQSSFLFPKKALETAGGFNPSFEATDDREILFRMGKIGKMYNIPDYVTSYRLHDSNTSRLKRLSMVKNDVLIVASEGTDYPHYARAVLYNIIRKYGYTGLLRPHLSDDFVAKLRKIRDRLYHPNIIQ